MYFFDALQIYFSDCRTKNLSPATISTYKAVLQKLPFEDLEDISPISVKRYIAALEGKPSYINSRIRIIKAFLSYLVEEDYLKFDVQKLKPIKAGKVKITGFSEKEVKAMVEYYSGKDFSSVKNKTIIAVLFDTGIRVSELAGIKNSDLHDGYILIRGKGLKERLVPISPALQKQLRIYAAAKEKRKLGLGYFFFSSYKKPLNRMTVRNILLRAAKASGVDEAIRISPHTCRHTYAHLMLKAGCDLYTLSRLLGHSDVSTTQRYLEGIKDDAAINKGAKLSPLNRL